MANKQLCSVEGCAKPRHSHGLCNGHVWRWKKHGDPLAGRASPGTLWQFLTEVVLPFAGTECLAWPSSLDTNGYGNITVKGRKHTAHRLVCEMSYGPALSSDHEAAHTCGQGHKACVNPHHLRWATTLENEADKRLHETDHKGERHPGAKLKESDVRAIRALHGLLPHPAIAARYGVTKGNVWAIVHRKSWPHVE